MRGSKVVLVLSLVVVGLYVFATAGISCAPKPVPAPLPAPAAFQIAELAINPAEVNPGEELTITARVTNTGGVEGSYTAELKINDVTEAAREVTVAAWASRLLSFSVSKDTPDTYRVALVELTGEFVVVKPAPPKPAPLEPAPPEPIPPKPTPPKPAPPKPTIRTWTLTDAEATHLLVKPISGSSIHLMPGNKAQLRYYNLISINTTVGISEGKLWLDGIPPWIHSFIKSTIGSYTSYSERKLFLTELPPWFDPTEEIAPDVTELPAFESITTEEGKATITYVWP